MLSISAKNSKDQNQCKRHASSDSSRLTESNMCTVLGPKTPVHEYNKSALQNAILLSGVISNYLRDFGI